MFEIDRRSPFLGLDVGRALEDRFRTLWGPLLDPFWARLGPCWGDLGASWGHLGPSRGHLGPLLAILRPSWGYVPAMLGYWGYLGPICDCLGAILSFIGAHVAAALPRPLLRWGDLGASWGHLGKGWEGLGRVGTDWD